MTILKKNLENKTTRLKAKKEALGVVQRAETDKVSTKGTVMSENQYDTLPKKVKTLLEEEKERDGCHLFPFSSNTM